MKYKKIIKKWQKWCAEEEQSSNYSHYVRGIKNSYKHMEYLLAKHRPKTPNKVKPKFTNETLLYIYSGKQPKEPPQV